MNYIHHIPGRLRVRTPALKQERLAFVVESSLLALPGIEEVRSNPIAGSVMIRYQPSVIAGDEIIGKVRAIAGCSAPHHSFSRARIESRINPAAQRALNKAVKAAGIYLLETALERSVVGIIAAIL